MERVQMEVGIGADTAKPWESSVKGSNVVPVI